MHVEKRLNEIVNRLNKTRNEVEIDYRAEREERDRKERDDTKVSSFKIILKFQLVYTVWNKYSQVRL